MGIISNKNQIAKRSLLKNIFFSLIIVIIFMYIGGYQEELFYLFNYFGYTTIIALFIVLLSYNIEKSFYPRN